MSEFKSPLFSAEQCSRAKSRPKQKVTFIPSQAAAPRALWHTAHSTSGPDVMAFFWSLDLCVLGREIIYTRVWNTEANTSGGT